MLADVYDPETRTLKGEPYIIGTDEFPQTYRLAEPQYQLPATPKASQL